MSLPRLFSLPKNTLVGAHTHFTKAGSILNRLLITLFLSLVYHRYSCYVIEGKNKLLSNTYMFISSVAQSCPTLQPHGLQHTRPPCPSPTPRVYSNSCPLSWWCYPTISTCRPLLLLPSVFPSIRVFSNESALRIRWPSIRGSASASVLSMNIQDWFPLGWIGCISLLSKGLSRVFSNTALQKH